ncbi:MAG TPA: alpha/beta hydrolase [Longimicrobium sp.]|nr:alpha/beta hydrolase [Longimicrobium sp.]
MNIRALALLLPLAATAACDRAPTLAGAGGTAPAAISYGAPVTAEGYLPGADGLQLHYRVYGSGPDTVVVLAGGPALPMSYLDRDLAPLAHGRTVIYYDARNAGFSQVVTDPALLAMDRHVADLEAVRQFFGIGQLQLVGHSWGAMVAPFYAAAHPQNVERMVLVTPGPIETQYDALFEAERQARTAPEILQQQFALFGLLASGQAPDPVATCEELFSLWFPAYFHDPANAANMRGRYCDMTPQAANLLIFSLFAGRASLGQTWDLAPMLAGIQTPALVIHGAGDAIPLASTAGYAEALPSGELLVIEGAGHFPWLEEPVDFFTAVNTFLRRGNL